jgi:thiamine transporter ThiT
MYNYILTRIAYFPIFLIFFVSGLCTGSVIGLIFILMDHSIGILGGAFLALLSGLLCGLLGLTCTAVFNILAPTLGGLPLKIQSCLTTSLNNEGIDPPDLPSY